MSSRKNDLGGIHTELERIRMKYDGRLQPIAVVEESTPEEAPLHEYFEWDDEVAAEQHRLWQARHLIRTVIVMYNERPVAAYVNVPESRRSDSYYVPMSVVVEQPDAFVEALGQLVQKVASAQRALDDLRHVAGSLPRDTDRLTMIALAVEAFAAASRVVQRIQ